MSRIAFYDQVLDEVESPDCDVTWFRAPGIKSQPDWEDKGLGLHDKYAGCCGFMRIVYSYFLNDNAGVGRKEAHSAFCWDCGKIIKKFIPHKVEVDGIGETVLFFGKHKGKKFSKVPNDYLTWCAENLKDEKVVKKVKLYLDQTRP
jgi:hypothetical protein